MSDLEIHMVPRNLYYHEVAYVRGLEAENERLKAALKEVVEALDGRVHSLAALAALDNARRLSN